MSRKHAGGAERREEPNGKATVGLRNETLNIHDADLNHLLRGWETDPKRVEAAG